MYVLTYTLESFFLTVETVISDGIYPVTELQSS